MEKLRMVVVIVHYKTPELLKACIATVLPELDGGRDRVIIVDGASGEEHVSQIRGLGEIPGVRLIELGENLGFAGANNIGIRAALAGGGADHFSGGAERPAPSRTAGFSERGRPEYFMLLNPDTLVRAGAFATLLRFLEEHPNAACVGPRLEYPDGTAQQSAFGDHTPISELLRGASIGVLSRVLKRWQVYGEIENSPHRADWIAGACMLLRSSVFDEIGLLDDGYFMYYEEVDFFRRARKRGLETWYEPAAHVVHLVGQSSGVTMNPGAKRLPAYWFDSRHRYFRKHFGYFGSLAADAAWLIGHALMRIRLMFTGVSHSAAAMGETRDLLGHSARRIFRPTLRERDAA